MPTIDPSVIAAAIGGMVAGAAMLWRIPHNECSECAHCKALAVTRAKAEHDRFHAYWGLSRPAPDCQRCKKWPHKE